MKINHINQTFINNLKAYFTSKDIQPNTKANYLIILKTCFKDLYKYSIINDDYNKIDYSVKKYDTLLPTITKQEIGILLNSRMKLEYDEIVRKKFLIQLFTGLRYSDLDQIHPNNIVNNTILVYTEKNEVPLEIPINSVLKPILEGIKNDVKEYLPIELNYYNQVVKRVFKKLKLNRSIQTIEEINNLIVTRNRPLYEVISSHVARRSAITILAEMGKSISEIKSITGHKDTASVDRYIKISKEHKTNIMDDYAKFLNS